MILNDKEINILIKLLKKSKKRIGKNFELIYRGSRDGWNSSDFHKKCDYFGKTISIIHTDNDNIFGGYTSIPWTSDAWQYKKDYNAFLFIIKSSTNYKPQIFTSKYSKEAVFHSSTHMCTFGGGHDICIKSKCNENSNSYSVGSSYCIPINKHTLNGDKKNFKVREIEVYLTG